ncbi:MAG: phosphate ABC transporter substrate-binding protein PstS [Dehalococcoidales bacterium]|nr:phosphate ABC transporter substrate-binding protein PstS [Dehalococcoidales bacterium]
MFKNLTRKWFKTLTPMLILVSIVLAGCSTTPSTPPTTTPPVTTPPTTATTLKPLYTGNPVDLNGAGATFPYPLYSNWFIEYNKLTGVKINYQSIGSGGGIQQITTGTVDFGATDGIMTANQTAAALAASGPILHIPMTSGAEAIIYNLPGIALGLKLTPDVLADIYLKKITKWNDARLTAINPGMTLPATAIAVVHRSDGSGTTYIFTNYLSKVSPEWSSKVGNANSVNWPGDIGGQGNAGVAGQVQQIPGAIGYVELAYALQNKMTYATIQNAAGNYIVPSLTTATNAAEGVTLPDNMQVMLTNSTNPQAYPIVGFTWVLAYVNQPDKAKGQTLVNFLWWAIHDGQQFTEPLSYARLSGAAVTKAENEILSINYQGQPFLTR